MLVQSLDLWDRVHVLLPYLLVLLLPLWCHWAGMHAHAAVCMHDRICRAYVHAVGSPAGMVP
jgi:hypothetical protein